MTQNSSKCIGCEMCVVACPLSVPFFDAALKVAVKCDFCLGALFPIPCSLSYRYSASSSFNFFRAMNTCHLTASTLHPSTLATSFWGILAMLNMTGPVPSISV